MTDEKVVAVVQTRSVIKFLRQISYQGLLVVIKVRDKRSSNTVKVWHQARIG